MNTSPNEKERSPSVLKYELLLLLMAIIWGSAFPVQSMAMKKGLGPLTFTGLRFAIGALVLLPLIFWRQNRADVKAGKPKLPYKACIAAGVCLFGAAVLQQMGLIFTSVANSSFITAFYILFVPLLGLFVGHKAPKILWLGILICLAGFYFLSVTDNFTVSRGDWLTVFCAIFWALQILVIDHAVGNSDPYKVALIQFAVCAVLSLAAGLKFEECSLELLKSAAGEVLFTGIMSVGVGFTLQVVCQKHCPPAPAAIIMSLESVFGAIFGYLILAEVLTIRSVLGCGLSLAGVLLVQLVPMMRGSRHSKE